MPGPDLTKPEWLLHLESGRLDEFDSWLRTSYDYGFPSEGDFSALGFKDVPDLRPIAAMTRKEKTMEKLDLPEVSGSGVTFPLPDGLLIGSYDNVLCTLSGSLGCCPLSPKRLFQKRMVGFLWSSLVALTSCSLSSRSLRFGDGCSFDGQSCPLRLTAFRALNGKDSASFQLLQLKRVCISIHISTYLCYD